MSAERRRGALQRPRSLPRHVLCPAKIAAAARAAGYAVRAFDFNLDLFLRTRSDRHAARWLDCFVNAEGEDAILSLLRGEDEPPGVNGRPAEGFVDLDAQAIADYSDLPLDGYGVAYGDRRPGLSTAARQGSARDPSG